MSLIVIKISLGTIQSKFVSTDCDEDKSKSVSYKQKKSYELKFYLQTENGPFRQACRIEFHIDTLQSNFVGINAKHAHLYQELSLRETGFRKWLKTIFCVLTVLI